MAGVKRIGLTGPIGGGKSTVAAILRSAGVPVLDADRLAHEGLEALADQVCRSFPDACPGGVPDRRLLAEQVFADEAARRRLEGILHPYVRRRLFEAMEQLERAGAPLVVLEIPLLYETGWERSLDGVLVVTAPSPLRYARLAWRGLSPEEVARREAAQLPVEEKVRRADWVIVNDADLKRLEERVRRWLEEVRA